MTPAQQKYLKERLTQIKNEKDRDIQKKYKDEYPSVKQKVELLREGKFSIRKNPVKDIWNETVEHYIEYEGVEDNSEIRNIKLKDLDREYKSVMDQVMLGDEAEVVQALRAFGQKEF